MPKASPVINETLYAYYQQLAVNEPDVLRELREASAHLPVSGVPAEQGQFLQMLIRLSGAKRVLEIGTLAGYSSLWMALALPEDGSIITCDRNETWGELAAPFWEKAGVNQQVERRIGDASVLMKALLEEEEQFDLIFIDADKLPYNDYYEMALKLLDQNGVILLDNMLGTTRSLMTDEQAKDIAGLRIIDALNRKIKDDERVSFAMLPIGFGLTLIRKQ